MSDLRSDLTKIMNLPVGRIARLSEQKKSEAFIVTGDEDGQLVFKLVNNASLINATSGDYEYYTQPFITQAVRDVMGRIDLDPASSAKANEMVRAERYYTEKTNGLAQPWNGYVYMNHPFGRESNPLWIRKLMMEFDAGNVTEAMCITFACTSEAWFKPLHQYPQCYLSPRTNYLLPDGSLKTGVTKGSVVTYLTRSWKRMADFGKVFDVMGDVKVPVSWMFEYMPEVAA